VNELVQNALEHAFVGRTMGGVMVCLRQAPGEVTVEVRDDGVGFDAGSPRQLGLELVETLVVEDLKGTWSLDSDGGTIARITIPNR
jgi:two-component sensor histidine kinase